MEQTVESEVKSIKVKDLEKKINKDEKAGLLFKSGEVAKTGLKVGGLLILGATLVALAGAGYATAEESLFCKK